MQINIQKKDRNGTELNIGDTIDLYDWGANGEKLATVKIVFDQDEGRVTTEPCIIDDGYDFWTKALPRSEKVVA